MAKEKHLPKKSIEAKLISQDAENTLYGLMLFLISLIGLLNNGFVGNFLTYISAYVFGVFYFVPFLISAAAGLYLILMKKTYLLKVNSVFLGVILITLASLIGASLSKNSTFNNMFANYHATISGLVVKDTIFQINLTKISLLGGGLLGRFFAALLNSTITYIGSYIVVAVLMVVGLYLTFAKLVVKIYRKTKEMKIKRKEKLAARLEQEEKERKEKQKLEETEQIKKEEKVIEKSPDNNVTQANPMRVASSMEIINNSPNKPKRASILTGEGSPTNSYQPPLSEKKEPTPINQMFADDIETKNIYEEKEEPVQQTYTPRNVEPTPVKENKVNPQQPTFNTSKSLASPVASARNTYIYPSLDLLNEAHGRSTKEDNERIAEERKEIINRVLTNFHTGAYVDTYTVGPTITRFDIRSSESISVNAIPKTIDDMGQQLGGVFPRFVKVVPGKTTSGLEVENTYIDMVTLREVLEAMKDMKPKPLLIPFGKDVAGHVVAATMTKFPHMLVAGSSGSGKSVFIHTLILSLIMRYTPEEVKFLIVDPKRVEFNYYRDMPHLLCPIIYEPLEAKVALRKLQVEMERRYVILQNECYTDIAQYNEAMKEQGKEIIPYLVVIIDEYNDLVNTIRDIEKPIIALGAKARAAGIHICIATQRPSTDVVTGTLRVNLQTRVAFKVSSIADSIVILDKAGADKLRGNGDSLIDCPCLSASDAFVRAQSPYVDRTEIMRVVAFLKEHYPVNYNPDFMDLKDHSAQGPKFYEAQEYVEDPNADRYARLKSEVVTNRATVSISFIQKFCGANFSTAKDFYNRLQEEGIIETLPPGSTNSKGARVLKRIGNNNINEEKEDEDYDDNLNNNNE